MLKLGNININDDRHTYVMGIVNATTDSFSDGGSFIDKDKAIEHAMKLVADGADIIDIGAESTRPGFIPVSAQEEIERLVPIIEGIRQRSDVPISIDTYKAKVAREVLKHGVELINDISFCQDEDMAKAVAKARCAYCLMHNYKNTKDGQQINDIQAYQNELADDNYVSSFMEQSADKIAQLVKVGVSKDDIIFDPGIGFNKNYQQNLRLIKALGGMKELGCQLLLGVSRKSVIGNTLDVPVDDRLEGTLALTAFAAMQDCKVVRVHDVKENVRVIKMLEAVLYC